MEQTNTTFSDPQWAQAFNVPPAPTQSSPMINYRGGTLSQPFDMRRRLRDAAGGKHMLGIWMGALPESSVARAVAQVGFDFVFLDWEHTPFGVEKLSEVIKTIQYAAEGNTAVIVRVPSHEHQYIAWALDAGASAVVLPHVETVEQAQAAVKAARFPMFGGVRSAPPNALLWGFNDGHPEGGAMPGIFNRAGLIMQIESRAGVKIAEDIAAVEGIDGLMLGPGDLILDMGLEFFTAPKNPDFIANAAAVAQAAKKHNKGALMPSMVPRIEHIWKLGYTMATCSNDGLALVTTLRQHLQMGHEQMSAARNGSAVEDEGAGVNGKEAETNGRGTA